VRSFWPSPLSIIVDCRADTSKPRQHSVSDSEARALALLAANPQGMSEGILVAHGISIDDMVGLVQAGLATATGERVRCGDRVIEVALVKITDAGREAIG